jgi:hypothetical protein
MCVVLVFLGFNPYLNILETVADIPIMSLSLPSKAIGDSGCPFHPWIQNSHKDWRLWMWMRNATHLHGRDIGQALISDMWLKFYVFLT